jgi:hypothetical protein
LPTGITLLIVVTQLCLVDVTPSDEKAAIAKGRAPIYEFTISSQS